MTDKKDPGKFTIRFNICDPQHKAVIDLLNRQGRSKAQFLVSAVLHYINCKETPEVSVPVPNQAALEEMILAILAKNQSYLKKQPEPKPSTAQQDAAISAASEPMPPADGAELEQLSQNSHSLRKCKHSVVKWPESHPAVSTVLPFSK